MLFFLSLTFAGETPLYQRALDTLQAHYLWEERLNPGDMFQEAGNAVEAKVEWLLVESSPDRLVLHDGTNAWHAEIEMKDSSQLAQALGNLEDAVLQGAATLQRPLDPELKLPVEILKGMVKPLDRHTVVLAGDGLERFDERITGTLIGIGASIGPDPSGQLIVKSLFAGGPAEKGGVQVGDSVLRVDGISTIGMTASDATRRIRGTAGTEVLLTVRRDGVEIELKLLRAELTIPNVSTKAGPLGTGLLSIDHFSEQTSRYLQEGLAHLGAEGLLDSGLMVDLRGNTGGSLIQSAQAADTFLSSGLIVRTAGRAGRAVPGLIGRMEARPEPPPFTMPLIVMMDRSTASGSEIMAGSLAQLGRALLVGTPSFGKGTVQKTFAIGPNIKLKMTVAEYLLDQDLKVAEVGLVPDLELSTVRFGKDTIWYADPHLLARLPANTPVLPVVQEEGKEDQSLPFVARLLKAATAGSRNALLEATRTLFPELLAEADAALVQAFAVHGLDWTNGNSAEPHLQIRREGKERLKVGEEGVLRFHLWNRGKEIYRAALRLRSVNSPWEDRVIPLGKLPEGVEIEVQQPITPEPGPSRSDAVEVWLESSGQAPLLVDTLLLGVEAPPSPHLRLSARYQPCSPCLAGQRSHVSLHFENPDRLPIQNFTTHFEFPEVKGIELLDEGSNPVEIPARGSVDVELGLTTEAGWSGTELPLELVMETKDRGRIGRWKLKIPLDGHPLVASAPSLLLSTLPTHTRSHRLHLSIRASDDQRLDHLVVFAGTESMNRSRATPTLEYKGDKIAWQPASGPRQQLGVDLPVAIGTNRYTVIAEDDQGLRTSQVVVVIGE